MSGKAITYGSFCSGIEAPSAAWHPLGWRPLFFSEIEKFPSRVLAHHYPTVPNVGDMSKIDAANLPACDVWIAGTPCQSFSVAGLRKGLTDERGNLTMVFVRLIRDAERNGIAPSHVVWENVPGVLSDKGNAFGCFIAGLVGATQPLVPTSRSGRWTGAGHVSGPEAAIAWRILDAQYFGVAQRRRRVFIVRCPTGGRDPAKILFECEGVRRDSPPSRTKGEGTSRNADERTASGGRPVMGTLTARMCTSLGPRDVEEGAEIVFSVDTYNQTLHQTLHQTLQRGTGCDQIGGVIHGSAVRRLTPIECERLQGFPDDYTNVPGASDGPRYKAIGNSMAVPVIRWIGKRIQQSI